MSAQKVPIRPSSVFGYSEEALYHVCRGCPEERGWLLMEDERGDCCEGILAIQQDVPGSIVERDGEPVCPLRAGAAS